ncbi:hydrogenase nickel incorporation protein HypA/HybF [Candidatus Kryptonium thompsonii]|uniref:Hydrogenase maturation factor HypA n=1 Tax=Candidatus Kryptonium thompsonii TaxID=1633631 RepID=A0A0P1M2N2_9BACT|nr:hydrogenase maturation nickel metallochaperone HypA [Candidatus Kryptonium thompsoni]CUS77074.1 hydrogenase nickel incorporation protein HypA/HybF [Candidatus Kryptonium thompsoni]CUS79180.1 hydrogenase nickel incorporation protein HypA/HybF [Candidatus Kryptonium thompsoni]CUS79440.1 hydrogenase nickel incorporation protein HypA/HybF [Candidatus Kryptonium thompsoni]CUS80231.1 hydrogenase nickel incorporation protein HypA/HybF [Candidatus Kryptonium thompsoni]CUS88879.1 hydrogenase nickel 
MHELSIAQSIIEIAENIARENDSKAVKKIKVQIGEFSGVVKEALEFSFDIAKVGTIAENAELEIEIVKFKSICNFCGFVLETMNDFNLFCPNCSEPMSIISGREMRVEYIEIE